MDLSQLERLKEEHKKGLKLCEDKVIQWKKFKTDYEALKLHLQTLPDAVSHDITVPFGPNAFTMGKLVHTNEVMVLLGDNWFAEVSAKQAMTIADRRIAQCDKMLDDLAKEKKQFENWLTCLDDLSNEDLVEIVEEYDEEKEKAWREQHSKNVKAYRKKLAEEKKQSVLIEESGVFHMDEDEYITKLEELELTETPEQMELSDSETCNKVPVAESCNEAPVAESCNEVPVAESCNEVPVSESCNEVPVSESCNEVPVVKSCNEVPVAVAFADKIPNHIESSESEISPDRVGKNNKPSLKLNIDITSSDQNVHDTESCEDDESKSDDVNSNVENVSAESRAKHVRWQDLSKQTIKKITFKHSKSKLHTSSSKHHVKKQDSSESEDSQSLIQSPSDIYKHFGNLFQATSPKSILKVKNSPTTPESDSSFFSVDEIVPKDSPPDYLSENIAFTGKVFERSSPIHIPQKKSSSRPVSHFKNSRKNRKR